MVLFNKPYGVVCQFSAHSTRRTLKDFIAVADVYPAGRLDWDSEGLVVLTADGGLQHRISDPRAKTAKTYWVQVEGIPDDAALRRLREGIDPAHAMQSVTAAVRVARIELKRPTLEDVFVRIAGGESGAAAPEPRAEGSGLAA